VSLSWDTSADVVVIGYGYAGAVAAIVAHDYGSRALILEKMEHPGGNSILSGGFFRIADNADKAFPYLRRMCLNTVPDDVIYEFCVGLAKLPGFMRNIVNGDDVEIRERQGTGGTYKFDGGPSGEAIGLLAINAQADVESCYPWLKVHGTGWMVFKVMQRAVNERGIEVRTSCSVKELVTDENGEVTGVIAEEHGTRVRIRANRAVIMATGGFEHNEQLKLQFFQAQPFYAVCALGNTGDGILMSQRLGAGLWHMWHLHGSYGFKAPGFPVAFRHRIHGRHGSDHRPRPGEEFSLKAGDEGPKMMPWIVVDKFGKRFMDEYPPAPQDTPWRDLSLYDPHIKDFPRIPAYMILDENGRVTGPLFSPISDDPSYRYDWSEDNTVELEKGWIKKAPTLEQLAGQINVDPTTLASTVSRWNDMCEKEEDTDFGRFAKSLFPIWKPPFYAVEVWPILTNTQGAVAHDRQQRVLDTASRAIPRLYVAGEMGGVFGHLYLNSGNNSEAVITGMIAGQYAAAESPWEESDALVKLDSPGTPAS
jgi:succinate dehydrogenase/fumarate reductase flavoprotein subunit